jgi:tape measure domain-containing protein
MTDRVIRVTLDASGVVQGANRATGATKKLKRSSDQMAAGFKAAARAASGFIAVLGFRELIRTADTFNKIQNSLRIVTDSTEELAVANERLFEIAQQTRAPFEATASLFSRASIAADELGASQEQLFRLTELSGKALAITGGSAAESAGALRQLSQSFSSGIVRGEEFNSILEGAFPLAQAAARGFGETGISVGKLRTLVIEGKVSSEEFFEAILKGGQQLDEQFAQTVPTVGQGLEVLNNSFITFVGAIDGASGASAGLATVMIEAAGFLGDLGNALTGTLDPLDDTSAGFNTFAIALITVGAALSQLFSSLRTGKEFFVAFAEGLGGLAAGVVQVAKGNFSEARAIFSDTSGFDRATLATTDFFEGFADNIDGAALKITDLLQPAFRTVREEAEAIADTDTDKPLINPNAAEDIAEAKDELQGFLTALNQASGELAIQAQLGDDADEAIRQYREDLALAAAANDIFGELVPTEEVLALKEAFLASGAAAIETQRALRAEIEAADLKTEFEDQIAALTEEIELLGADSEALGANAEARALAAGATADQAAKIGELTTTLADEQEALKQATLTFEGFFEEVGASAQQTLSGFLADPLSEGLDELPFQFAQVLQKLAADALASELFKILQGFGSSGSGGGAGGFLQFIGGLFGGGFQAGGAVRGGQPILVGERGPELFSPPGSGQISPNVNINQAAQAAPTVNVVNVTDPADIPAGLRTDEGEEEVINILQRNPDAVRRILG